MSTTVAIVAWFRWHEGTSSDPKLHLIARKSGQPVAFALAIWAMLLERASAAEDRGDVGGFDCESADAALGMPDGAAQAIYDAMIAKGMIADGRVAKWEARQPKKEDATSTERVRNYRAKQKAKADFASSEANCQETPCSEVKHYETQCNATKRHATLDKIRREYIKPPLPPHAGGECDLHASGTAEPQAASVGSKPEEPSPECEPRLVAKSGRGLAGKAFEDFDRFWTDFGLSRGKAEAADAWLDIPGMTDALVARICEAAQQEAADRPRLEGRGQKPKLARGWLLSRRWEDYEAPKARDLTRTDGLAGFGGDFDPEVHDRATAMRKRLEAERLARKNGGMAAIGENASQ